MTDERLINDDLLMIRGLWFRTYVRTDGRTKVVLKSLSRLKIKKQCACDGYMAQLAPLNVPKSSLFE